MSTLTTGRIQAAELATPSRVSSAVLSVVSPAQVAASVESTSVALSLSGAAEVSLSLGEVDASFVMPELGGWHIVGINGDSLFQSVMYVVPDTFTTGDLCAVQFELRIDEDVAVTFTVSDPEQASPHAASGATRDASYMGALCDLYWRWWSGARFGDYELVCSDCISIPGHGDEPTDGEG